jgi:hypothetical protein
LSKKGVGRDFFAAGWGAFSRFWRDIEAVFSSFSSWLLQARSRCGASGPRSFKPQYSTASIRRPWLADVPGRIANTPQTKLHIMIMFNWSSCVNKLRKVRPKPIRTPGSITSWPVATRMPKSLGVTESTQPATIALYLNKQCACGNQSSAFMTAIAANCARSSSASRRRLLWPINLVAKASQVCRVEAGGVASHYQESATQNGPWRAGSRYIRAAMRVKARICWKPGVGKTSPAAWSKARTRRRVGAARTR